jgi:hypothetical protein
MPTLHGFDQFDFPGKVIGVIGGDAVQFRNKLRRDPLRSAVDCQDTGRCRFTNRFSDLGPLLPLDRQPAPDTKSR